MARAEVIGRRLAAPEAVPRFPHRGTRLGSLFGVEVTIDPSWLLIFVLVTWSLAVGFGEMHPGWSFALQVATALVASLLFFASVLAHELAHSLVARARGLPVRRITLFLFGGVSNLEREPSSPSTEFVMAVVGPLTSVLLGLAFLLLSGVPTQRPATIADATGLLSRLTPLSTLLAWLGSINVVVGLFNVVPAFPLDGGRMLRSVLWGGTKDLRRATHWASQVGVAFSWAFVLAGFAMIFGARIPLLGTGFIGGLWIAMIGWFLHEAAASSYRQFVVDDLLEGVPVAGVMRRDPPTVSPDISVARLVHESLLGTDERAFPVIDGGRLAGLVCLEDVRRVPRDRWDATSVREVMTPASRLSTVAPDADAASALRELTRLDVRQVPVVEGGGRLVGLLRRRDLVRWLYLQADVA